MSNQFLPKAYLKGKVIDFKNAHVSIATHALHYGTAAFAGLRAEPGVVKPGHVALFRPELHAQRLSNSAKILGYSVSQDKILAALKEFIASNPGSESYYIRPLVYVSDLGIAPRLHNVEHDLLIYGVKMGEYLSNKGISCCFSSWMRGEDRSLPLRGKISGSYVTSALAKTEAEARGFDEAILLNTAGKVAEASAMNIFIVRDGVLVTPPVTADILEGVTRRSVIEIAKNLGIPMLEREIDKSELLIADEVFLTGTAARIAPVKKVESYNLPDNYKTAKRINLVLKNILGQNLPEYADWVKLYKSSTSK